MVTTTIWKSQNTLHGIASDSKNFRTLKMLSSGEASTLPWHARKTENDNHTPANVIMAADPKNVTK